MDKHPKDYFVPNFGVDHEIKASLKNTKDAEAKLGTWTIPKEDVQLESDVWSDPICSSAGCNQYLHPESKEDFPKGYGVPDFGVDRDIIGT